MAPRDTVLTLVVVSLPLRRRLRRLPATLREHFATYRHKHGAVVALAVCWLLAGTEVRLR